MLGAAAASAAARTSGAALAARASRMMRLALMAAAALAAACGGGGGGGGGGPTTPPPLTSSIVFTPAGGGSILLASGAGTQGTTLALDVRTVGIQDLYGVAFHLTYPAAVMHFVGATEGTVLNAAGALPTSFQAIDSPPGNLVIGLTRLGQVAGTAAAGTLMTLQFNGVATGSGSLAFTNNQAGNSTGGLIPGLTWAGGTVQVTIVPGAAVAH
jgi:hypothetical protein